MHHVVKYIPDWFPGAHFKKLAKQWSVRLENVARVPFDSVKAGIVRANSVHRIVAYSLTSV